MPAPFWGTVRTGTGWWLFGAVPGAEELLWVLVYSVFWQQAPCKIGPFGISLERGRLLGEYWRTGMKGTGELSFACGVACGTPITAGGRYPASNSVSDSRGTVCLPEALMWTWMTRFWLTLWLGPVDFQTDYLLRRKLVWSRSYLRLIEITKAVKTQKQSAVTPKALKVGSRFAFPS